MALTLVVVAQQLLTFELIPISNMRLWIDKFVGWSFYWVLLTLLESVGIGFMWYLREDRIARKERKRLSTATAAAAAEVAANDEEVSEEEEVSPLTCSKIIIPTTMIMLPTMMKMMKMKMMWKLIIKNK
jgi:hypothetical protein